MSAVSNSIAVICVSANEKIMNQCVINVPANSTVADLKAAMSKTQAVQVLVSGAAPSDCASIADLAAAYASSEDGLLHVDYSVEASFGKMVVCTPLGGAAQW